MSDKFDSIEHKGIVQKSDNNSVTVSMISSAACAGCHAEGICSLSGQQEKIVEIPGMYQVHPGDNVTIRMKQSSGHIAVFLGYVMPLILLVAVLIILISLSVPELTAGLGALAVLIPYYFILYIFRNKISRKFIFTLKA
jgi:sigma-E factor negative regulatory protein RseC